MILADNLIRRSELRASRAPGAITASLSSWSTLIFLFLSLSILQSTYSGHFRPRSYRAKAFTISTLIFFPVFANRRTKLFVTYEKRIKIVLFNIWANWTIEDANQPEISFKFGKIYRFYVPDNIHIIKTNRSEFIIKTSGSHGIARGNKSIQRLITSGGWKFMVFTTRQDHINRYKVSEILWERGRIPGQCFPKLKPNER